MSWAAERCAARRERARDAPRPSAPAPAHARPRRHCAKNIWVVKPAAEGSAGRLAFCSTLAEIKTALVALRGDAVVQKCACARRVEAPRGCRASRAA